MNNKDNIFDLWYDFKELENNDEKYQINKLKLIERFVENK
mgnify:FL=1